MQITVRTHHVDITPSLKSYAHSKIQKLEKYFENIQAILIELDMTDAASEDDRQEAKATIWAAQTIIRATDVTRDMYASIDGLVDKLEKQLKKHNEKMKDHKQDRNKRSLTMDQYHHRRSISHATSEPRFIPKPMTPEDAALLLSDNQYDFLVFRNSNSDQINVLYSRSEGELGLIETH